MTIEARMADGTTLRFPDGTADAVIDRAVKGETMRAKVEAKRKDRAYQIGGGAFGGMTNKLADNFTFGLADDVAGIAEAAGSAIREFPQNVRNAVSGQSPDFSRPGRVLAESFNRGKGDFQDSIARAEREAPSGSMLAGALGIAGSIATPTRAIAGVQSLRQAAGVGATQGAVGGSLAGVGASDGNLGERAASAGLGAVGGAVIGGGLGAALPVAGRMIGNGVSAIRSMAGKGPSVAPRIISDALRADNIAPRAAGQMIDEAQARGVPLSLADVGDNMRGLAASVGRQPGPSRTIVRDMAIGRQEAQGDRIASAVARDLGPVANPREVSEGLQAKAKEEAGPLYKSAYAFGSVDDPTIQTLLTHPELKQAVEEGMRLHADDLLLAKARGEDVSTWEQVRWPSQTDISNPPAPLPPERVPMPSDLPDEATALTPRKTIGAYGKAVNRRGPADLVTWLRSQGGLKDAGGELTGRSGIGLNNKPRSIDYARNEGFLGSLVNGKKAMSLDDAAQRAWEEGYFPEFNERPTVAEFLDAVRGTYAGHNRRFLVDDYEELDNFQRLQGERFSTMEEAERIADKPQRGRPTTQAEMESLTASSPPPEMPDGPRFGRQSIAAPDVRALDYVKRGLDKRIDAAYSGDSQAKARVGFLKDARKLLLERIDEKVPDYKAARAAYAGPTSAKEALEAGQSYANKTADDILVETRDLSPFELDQYRLGVRAAMTKMIESKGDYANKVQAIVGTPKKRMALGKLFGGQGDFNRFLATLADEGKAAQTYRDVATGSQTANKLTDDALSNDTGLVEAGSNAVVTGLSGRPISALINAVREARRYGVGEAGKVTRAEIAVALSETDPVILREALKRAVRDRAKTRAGIKTRGAMGAEGRIGGQAASGLVGLNSTKQTAE